MLKFLIKPFLKPTALELAVSQLEEAKRFYLKSMSSAEYHAAQAGYYDGVISRLNNYIKESTE